MHEDLWSLQHFALQYGDWQRGQLKREARPHTLHSLPSPVSSDRDRATFIFVSAEDLLLEYWGIWLSVATVVSDVDTLDVLAAILCFCPSPPDREAQIKFKIGRLLYSVNQKIRGSNSRSLSSCCIISSVACSPSFIHHDLFDLTQSTNMWPTCVGNTP